MGILAYFWPNESIMAIFLFDQQKQKIESRIAWRNDISFWELYQKMNNKIE
jgi:hypothetical protein